MESSNLFWLFDPFTQQGKSLLLKSIFQFLFHFCAWVSCEGLMKHQIHKFFHICQKDTKILFRSYLRFFSFSFWIFESRECSIIFQLHPTMKHLWKVVYFEWSNLWFYWSWFNWVSKLSRIIGSNILFYHILGKLRVSRNGTWICGVTFFHDDLIHNGLVLLLKNTSDVIDFVANPVL